MKAGVVFILTGAAIIIYFREERSRMERKKIAEQTKGIGRPKVGGPFNLVDHDGRPFTEQDLKGKYALVGRGIIKGSVNTLTNLASGLLWLYPLPRYLS